MITGDYELTTSVLQHNIGFFYNTADYPDLEITELPESEDEHIAKMITEGCSQGELCYYDQELNDTLYGWWSILKDPCYCDSARKDTIIYLLYSCDEWKSYNSMCLITASIDENKIKKEVIERIGKGDMEYSGSSTDELKSKDLSHTKDLLKYGHIMIITDGEDL